MRKVMVFAVCAALLYTSCGRKKRVRVAIPAVVGSLESGIASWYGHPYHGRASASGEIYDMETLTAAHRTLPFGTWVRVRNLSNSKTVEVRIIEVELPLERPIRDTASLAEQREDLVQHTIKVHRATLCVSAGQRPDSI